ncbi:MAG: hypothetical protein JWO94_2456 [Verrucomicrobiaceae bacterium]|nr:hypothetical protein [Verrucomicrobiaceae bacterium]
MQSQPPNDPRVTAIVRKHAHDVRNYINSLDLEASFIEELVTDPEVIESARRMRGQLRHLEVVVKSLSVKFSEPRPIAIPAPDLLHLWKYQVDALEESSGTIEWAPSPPPMAVMLDPGVVTLVLRELVMESWGRSRALKAAVVANSEEVTAEIEWASASTPASDMQEHILLIQANGGRLERARNPVTGLVKIVAAFPVVAD